MGGGRPKGVIRANQTVQLLRLERLADRPQVWERFVAARQDLGFETCYCSIIGDCWESDLQSLDPRGVEQCDASPDDYLEFGAGFDDMPVLPYIERP